MSFDEDASKLDLAAANRMVVKDFQTFMENMKTNRVPAPPGAARMILDKLMNSQYLTNFYSKLNDKIVQADFSFSGTIVQGTSVNRVGDTWRIKFTIDADVPPAGSQQKPHIGYEISVDGTKKQVGHKFFTGLTVGRPGLGVDLVEHGREESKATLPNGDTMEWSFVYWRLR
jgi:hypothetical protein